MYCQKCRTPLKLDGSIESLNPAAFDLLSSSSISPNLPFSTNSFETLQASRYQIELPRDRRIRPNTASTTTDLPNMLCHRFTGGLFPPLEAASLTRSPEPIAAICHL